MLDFRSALRVPQLMDEIQGGDGRKGVKALLVGKAPGNVLEKPGLEGGLVEVEIVDGLGNAGQADKGHVCWSEMIKG